MFIALIHRNTKLSDFQYFVPGPDEETADLDGLVTPPDGDTEAVDRGTTDLDLGAEADADGGNLGTESAVPD